MSADVPGRKRDDERDGERDDERGDGLPPLRQVIAEYGLSARKGLGQHFLLDLNLTRRIARAAGDLSEAVVIEVGPGPGGLTRALLMEGAHHVLAIERDPRCLEALAQIEAAYPGQLSVVEADALKTDEPALLADMGLGGRPVKIVANLPYNVGTALLVRWLTSPQWPPFFDSLTLMFQLEVAERVTAAPGTDAYGRLAVLAQWRARTRFLFEVGARAFTPPPKVTSAVISVHPGAPTSSCDPKVLERVTQAAFAQRRKMLRASLKGLHPHAEEWIRGAGLEPTQRPETVDVAGFCRLAETLPSARTAP